METNSLVVTDSNVQALANTLCVLAEKMGELSRQYPEYPNSLMGPLQQLEDAKSEQIFGAGLGAFCPRAYRNLEK